MLLLLKSKKNGINNKIVQLTKKRKKIKDLRFYLYTPKIHRKIIVFCQLGLILGLIFLIIEVLMDYLDISIISCDDFPEKDPEIEKSGFFEKKWVRIVIVCSIVIIIIGAGAYYCTSYNNQTQTVDSQPQTVDNQTQTEVLKASKNTTHMSTIMEHDLLKREEFKGNNNASVTEMGFYQEAFYNVKKSNSDPNIASMNENLADEAAKWHMDHRLFGNVEPKYLKKGCKRILTNSWRFSDVDVEKAKEYRDFLRSTDSSKRNVVSLISFLRKIYGINKLDECFDDDDDEAIDDDDDVSSSSSFAQKDE
jgi:hypothetical protein